MASLSTTSASGNSILTSSFTSSSSSLLSSAKPSQILVNNIKCIPRFNVSCLATGGDRAPKDEETNPGKLHRRNMVLGLGGLYGAATLIGDQLASAEPIHYPDLTKCGTAYIPIRGGGSQAVPYSCCPPVPTTEIKKYQLPKDPVMRIRPAAHLVDDKYVEKYAAAIDAMKKLNDDDPLSFTQQANIHCAYCNSSYRQDGDSSPEIQIHGSWLFLPFHRWYLHFFERILGKLIDDPTFALPYWNWDAPCGMTLPYMFNDPSSPLFDPKRNQAHLPPKAIDLGFDGTDYDIRDVQLVCNNLTIMYRQLLTNATNPADFLGQPYRLGDSSLQNGAGSLEIMPHATGHRWVGDPRESFRENMGNFYSAAKDPIFYCHHANVDRMWTVWKTIGGRRDNFQDPDWKQATFFFYDENAQPVYVTVEDCLSTEAMGYTYQPMELPWLRARPMPRKKNPGIAKNSGAPAAPNALPATLETEVKVVVQRQKSSRTKEAKEQKEEVLVIEGIEFPLDKYVKFDVFINDEDDKNNLIDKAEYAGSFTYLPHVHDHSNAQTVTASLRLGLNEILEDLQAEGDELILVTIVPKSEGASVKVNNIRIDYA